MRVKLFIIIHKIRVIVYFNQLYYIFYCLMSYIYNMEKHILHANNLLKDISKDLCAYCTNDKEHIKIAIYVCKTNLDTLRRDNSIRGKTNEFEQLEQVIQWNNVKEYLKGLL